MWFIFEQHSSIFSGRRAKNAVVLHFVIHFWTTLQPFFRSKSKKCCSVAKIFVKLMISYCVLNIDVQNIICFDHRIAFLFVFFAMFWSTPGERQKNFDFAWGVWQILAKIDDFILCFEHRCSFYIVFWPSIVRKADFLQWFEAANKTRTSRRI